MSETPRHGRRILLTADRTQLADYRTLLDGMLSAAQTTLTPLPVVDVLFAPAMPCTAGRAVRAPMGLRRVEAALLDDGFSPDDVVVVPPEKLDRAVGPDTRIIAVSTGDPVGLGMNTSTMVALAGGRPYTTMLFQRLAGRLRRLRARFGNIRIVVGGPGAWQLARSDADRRRLGIDHVLTGYCEAAVARTFRDILNGDAVGEVVPCVWRSGDGVPAIRGATTMGIVEISRGCGLGCDFCTLAKLPMTHLAPAQILADVETNLRAGVRDVSLISEDLFRYGGETAKRTNPQRLLALLRAVRAIPAVRMIQIDHANVSSVASFSDDELAETHALLAGDFADRHVWVNLGVETVSPPLLAGGCIRAKMRPATPESWGDVCREQVQRLSRAGFMPMVSLMTGLPGETDVDVDATTRWVRTLRGERVVVFPMLLAPITPGGRPRNGNDMTAACWRLFHESYRFNFKWVRRMLWSEETHAGLALPRRLVVALLGHMNTVLWKALFTLKS